LRLTTFIKEFYDDDDDDGMDFDDLDRAFLVFTALHEMQTRSSDENSVCPSVRPSVTRVYCDKTVERSVQIYIPYERTFSLVF